MFDCLTQSACICTVHITQNCCVLHFFKQTGGKQGRPVFSRIWQAIHCLACVLGYQSPVTGYMRHACILVEICKLAQACRCMTGLRQPATQACDKQACDTQAWDTQTWDTQASVTGMQNATPLVNGQPKACYRLHFQIQKTHLLIHLNLKTTPIAQSIHCTGLNWQKQFPCIPDRLYYLLAVPQIKLNSCMCIESYLKYRLQNSAMYHYHST